MNTRKQNDNFISTVHDLFELGLASGPEPGVAFEQLKGLARLVGIQRWRIAPCGRTNQPAQVLEHIHTTRHLRVYGPRANRAAGYVGNEITSAGVLGNLAAHDIVVIVDPAQPLGQRLLGLPAPLDTMANIEMSAEGCAIQQGAARDAREVLRWVLDALRSDRETA